MTEEIRSQLRRSTRVLLERDGYPGPGPGRMALVMARAGTGKTAFLVGIGLDALLAGQKVLHVTLHRTVEKVRAWYDEMLDELVRSQGLNARRAEIMLDIERSRHIRTFFGQDFNPGRLREFLRLLETHAEFSPDVLILDRLELETTPPAAVAEFRRLAQDIGAELWMSCRTHRDSPKARPGCLPPPAEGLEELVDLAVHLDQEGEAVRLHVLKDRDQVMDKGLPILLDPTTLLLVSER